MTQLEYIDFIRNSLSMVDKTAKFHREQVKAAVNFAMNTVFYDMYLKGSKDVQKSMERYSTLVSLSVAADSELTNRYTATLSVDVVDLPRVTGGVLEIMSGTLGVYNTGTTFIPVSTMTGEQMYGSESSLPSNVIGFSFSGARQIEFWDFPAGSVGSDHRARIIQQFKSYDATDNVMLPFGKDEQIMELVRQYLGVIPPKDLVNNNADNNG